VNLVPTLDGPRYRGVVTTPPTEEPSSVLALVGMMGSGKSTVGALLADRTGRAFVDLDSMVEASSGRSVAALFADEGERGFRDRELAALEEVLGSSQPTVLATGGGVVTTGAGRDALTAGATVVWLDVPVADLAARVGHDAGRPLLGEEPLESLKRLDAERRALYESVADIVVDGRDAPEGVADKVQAALGVIA
jgi:shikimate kinase